MRKSKPPSTVPNPPPPAVAYAFAVTVAFAVVFAFPEPRTPKPEPLPASLPGRLVASPFLKIVKWRHTSHDNLDNLRIKYILPAILLDHKSPLTTFPSALAFAVVVAVAFAVAFRLVAWLPGSLAFFEEFQSETHNA